MPRPEFANPAGNVQGGFICAMLDDAMGITASVSQRFALMVPTLQMSVSYLEPTPIARVIARGSPRLRQAPCCGRFRTSALGKPACNKLRSSH